MWPSRRSRSFSGSSPQRGKLPVGFTAKSPVRVFVRTGHGGGRLTPSKVFHRRAKHIDPLAAQAGGVGNPLHRVDDDAGVSSRPVVGIGTMLSAS